MSLRLLASDTPLSGSSSISNQSAQLIVEGGRVDQRWDGGTGRKPGPQRACSDQMVQPLIDGLGDSLQEASCNEKSS